MAGLLSNMPGAAGPQPGGAMAGPQAVGAGPQRGATDPTNTDGQQPNVSPEEQAEYDEFVNNALNLIYDEKTKDRVIERLGATDDPVDDLANTVAVTVMGLQDSAERSGRKISDDVLFHGGIEILEDLANLAEKAGIHSFSEDELEAATYRALDTYREMATQAGKIDPEALKQEFGSILQADKQGALEQVLPGIGQAAQKFSAQQR